MKTTIRLLAAIATLALVLSVAPADADTTKAASPEQIDAARAYLPEQRDTAPATGDGDHQAAATGTFGDPSNDVVNVHGQRMADGRGDITSIALSNEATIELRLTTRTAGSLSSANWTEGVTGIIWSLDVNGNQRTDFDVYLLATGGPVRVDVDRADGTTVCSGTGSQSGATYIVRFAATCIGSPGNAGVNGFFVFDTDPRCTSTPCDGSEIALDAAPDDLNRFFGPVARGSAAPAPAPAPAPSPFPAGTGYWFIAADGGVFSYNATFHGSAVGRTTTAVVGLAGHPTSSGYWVVEANGRVHAFGAARHHGDVSTVRLNQPIVDIEATPSGNGYYLLARDGGIFTFGDAPFHGSTGNIRLNQPVVGLGTTRA
jgi:hypothetical protein